MQSGLLGVVVFDHCPCAVSVLSSWRVQSKRGDSAAHHPVAPDFVSLNRDAVKSGLVTSKELSQYRAQRGGAASQKLVPKKREGGASRRPAVPDIMFGVTTRSGKHPQGRLLFIDYRFTTKRSVHQGAVSAVRPPLSSVRSPLAGRTAEQESNQQAAAAAADGERQRSNKRQETTNV